MIIRDKDGNVFNDGSLIEKKIDFKPMITAKKTTKTTDQKAAAKTTTTAKTTTRKPRTPKVTKSVEEPIEVKAVEVIPPTEPAATKRRGRKPKTEGGKMVKVTSSITPSNSKTQPGIIVETQDGDKVTLSQGTVDKLTGIVETIVTRLLGI